MFGNLQETALFLPCYGTTAARNYRDQSIAWPRILEKGFVFFVPHRRGQGRSPGPYIMDELNALSRDNRNRMLVEFHEIHLRDQLAGLEYLKSLTFVDRNRIAVMGFSFGGIQTMLAVERGPVISRRGELFGSRRILERLFEFAIAPYCRGEKSDHPGVFSAGGKRL